MKLVAFIFEHPSYFSFPQVRHYVYNIYDYDEQNPVVWDYDIGRCFNISQKRDFKFILPGIFSIDIYREY